MQRLRKTRENQKLLVLLSVLLIGSSSCSSSKQRPTRLKVGPPPRGLGIEETSPTERRIMLVSTGNIKGQIDPSKIDLGEKNTQYMEVGGINSVINYSKILKEKYGKQLALIDTGNLLNNDRIWYPLYAKKINLVRYDAQAVSHPDFTRYLTHLHLFKGNPLAISNAVDVKKNNYYKKWPVRNEMLFTKNGVRIGLISVSEFEENEELPHGIIFEDQVMTALKKIDRLRRRGAQVVGVIGQFHSHCFTPPLSEKFLTKADSGKFQLTCPGKGHHNVANFLNRLPPNSIDFVLASSSHQVAGFVGNTPVVMSDKNGHFMGGIELIYDRKYRRLSNHKTKVLAPVKLCMQQFSETGDCLIKDKIRNVAMVPAQFMGQIVHDHRP